MLGAAQAAPPEEAIRPSERYKNERARTLAVTYGIQLRQIYDAIYRCHEWVHIRKEGLGFRTPKAVAEDSLYLTLWVWIDQQMTPAFAAAPAHQRASAMLQQYGIDLLRQLSSHRAFFQEAAMTGFGVVLTWIKPGGEPGRDAPGVNEALAFFVDKVTLHQFLGRETRPAQFVERAIISGFDGKRELGRLPLEISHRGPPGTADGQPAC